MEMSFTSSNNASDWLSSSPAGQREPLHDVKSWKYRWNEPENSVGVTPSTKKLTLSRQAEQKAIQLATDVEILTDWLELLGFERFQRA